ncbi:MAG TPA: glycosyltransferase family 2 protein [Candidatus Polarisedimenticolia bacterium]|nr:glycosyltransferase family 2 protein [Candidatus Polarisedimenticolia bacterium]
MENPPKISVVTPSYNSIHTIRETIESVKNQDYPKVEHIVMDGGSTDGTLKILAEYPHLKVISEKDEGHYHAMNKGIEMATGEAINILNADDCYCPGILKKIGDALVKHPEWDGVFGDMIFIDDHGTEIFRREEAYWDPQIVRLGWGIGQHQTLFIRKRTYNRLGLLRHKDFKNCCDYEFLMRMAHNGCKIGSVHDYVVRYRYHQHGQSADERVTANMRRESAQIRREYGVPGGFLGKVLGQYARLKRQIEKIFILGKCDLVPGKWLLKKHMRPKTEFSSNIGLDKL